MIDYADELYIHQGFLLFALELKTQIMACRWFVQGKE